MNSKCLSKSQQLDFITTLPQSIIETILCCLPIQEAARTSILSKEWRYKWTKIPTLEFFQSSVKIEEPNGWWKHVSTREYWRRKKNMWRKLFYAILQVLLLRQGPIDEFILSMDAYDTCVEIDQIILHLSMNHKIKKLGFYFHDMGTYSLPSCFFSLLHLTELYLEYCDFKSIPIFNVFGSLTRLTLSFTRISKETLLNLLSNCPSLKRFCLILFEEHFLTDEKPSIMELFKCLPAIEHLTTWGYIIPSFVQASVPHEPPVSLIHLKCAFIRQMCFVDGYGLPFLAVLIKCSPNLEKIKLAINANYDDEIKLEKLEEYSNVWLQHLNELEIAFLRNYKPELEFVKFILARSPNLKKLILVTPMVNKNEEFEMFKVLLSARCLSPVKIVVKNDFEDFYNDY